MDNAQRKQTALRYICAMIIFISAVLGLYEYFVLAPQQAKTYVISPLSIINSSIARPALWSAVGFLIASIFLQVRSTVGQKRQVYRIFTWAGILLIAAYGGLAAFILLFSGTGTVNGTLNRGATAIFIWLIRNTPVFIFPGILLGAGLSAQSGR